MAKKWINAFGMDLLEKVEITRSEMISKYGLKAAMACTSWAITFAKEWKDSSVVDLDKYRESLLKQIQEAEDLRAKYCGDPEPKKAIDMANQYLAAMKGKRSRDYTMGLPATFN